jgi:Double zinc ribbon
MTLALFGITNDGLNLAVNLLILFLVVLWLALVAWTYLDARRRISDPVLVACATAASLFPFVGTVVYSILRPPEFLADKRERELEIRASELRVRQLEEASCPNCEHPVERNFLRCPSCRARIKDPCESCGKPIDPRWSVCPYCETPQRRAAPPERRPPSKRRSKAPATAEARSEPPPKARRSSSRTTSSRSAGSRAGSGSRSRSAAGATGKGSETRASAEDGSKASTDAGPGAEAAPKAPSRSSRSSAARSRSGSAPPEPAE